MLIEIIIGIGALILVYCIGFRLGVNYMEDHLIDYDLHPKSQDIPEPEQLSDRLGKANLVGKL